jgi:hypothetical protein
MAKEKRIQQKSTETTRHPSPLISKEVPAWLDRIQSNLPHDGARKIFLNRLIDAVIEMTATLPPKAIEKAAAASSNLLVLLTALRSPEMLPDLERHEPLASPYLRGLQAQQDLIKQAGGLISADDAAGILRLTRQAIDKRRIAGKLIAIPQGQRGFGYPVCQFTSRGLLPGLEQLLLALDRNDAWMQLTFLLSPNSNLNNHSPLELLSGGQIDAVTNAASKFGDHGAL